MDEPAPVEESNGSVFAALGLPQPEERLFNSELGRHLRNPLAARGPTQRGLVSCLASLRRTSRICSPGNWPACRSSAWFTP